jgi:hypothetical protein
MIERFDLTTAIRCRLTRTTPGDAAAVNARSVREAALRPRRACIINPGGSHLQDVGNAASPGTSGGRHPENDASYTTNKRWGVYGREATAATARKSIFFSPAGLGPTSQPGRLRPPLPGGRQPRPCMSLIKDITRSYRTFACPHPHHSRTP